jgi:Holliday junction resolvase
LGVQGQATSTTPGDVTMGEIPKYFSEDKSKHVVSKKQEKRVARKLGGRRQKGSGSMAGHKGDVKSVELLTECKHTEKESIRITRKWLEKVSQEADFYGKVPALAIEFSDKRTFDHLPEKMTRDWVMVPAQFLTDLIGLLREQEEGDE